MANQTTSQTNETIALIASIKSMERGKLSEVYRELKKGHDTVRLGPYYKLQAWENGKNRTRHIPSAQVEGLKKDLANHEEFTRLVNSLEETIISNTRESRASDSKPSDIMAAKKNSTKKACSKNTTKPRPS